MDARLQPRLDQEVGSSLDDEYSVNCVSTKVAWYSSCVRCIIGGQVEGVMVGVKDGW